MGFHTVTIWLGVIIIVFVSFFTLVSGFQTHFLHLNKAQEYEEFIAKLKRTEINITSANYNDTHSKLSVIVENTGSEVNNFNNSYGQRCVDLFVDGLWIPHDQFQITLLNQTFQTSSWNPDESIELKTTRSLESGNHKVKVASCRAKTDSFSLSVP